jgi:SAM-dependent MidA family methyltransferase
MSWLGEIALSEGGRLRFDRFMELALLHPVHGYYARKIQGIGRSGDFSTSTTLDSTLGRAVFRWLMVEARLLEIDPVVVIEPGIGTGAMAGDILSQLRPWQRLKYFGVDLQRDVCLLDKAILHNRRFRLFSSVEEALAEADGRAIVISNEFVDAFPCRRLVRLESGWADIYLSFENEQWRQELLPAEISFQSSALEPGPPIGQIIETQESYRAWLGNLSTGLVIGSVLTIDYGGRPEEIYQRKPAGTVRGYFKQERVAGMDIFRRPGQQDLTADVNFIDLQLWGNSFGLSTVDYLMQREFVIRWFPNALKKSSAAATFILDENGAGAAFKVLHQRKKSAGRAECAG